MWQLLATKYADPIYSLFARKVRELFAERRCVLLALRMRASIMQNAMVGRFCLPGRTGGGSPSSRVSFRMVFLATLVIRVVAPMEQPSTRQRTTA